MLTMIKVERKPLLAALNTVKGSVPKVSTIPVIQNFFIATEGTSGLVIRGTDLEVSMTTRLDTGVTVEKGDASTGFCLPAGVLVALLSKMTGDIVTIDVDKKSARIVCDRQKAELPVVRGEDFPSFATIHELSWQRIPRLLDLLRFVSVAMSRDASRPNMCGANICASHGKVAAVATDGHRLMACFADADDAPERLDASGVILPAVGVAELLRLGWDAAQVAIAEKSNVIWFRHGASELSIRLVDGHYPPWGNVVPSTTGRDPVAVNRDELISAIAFLAEFGRGDGGARTLRVNIEAGEMRLERRGSESGSGGEQVLTVDMPQKAEAKQFGVNSSYIAQALGVIAHAEAHMFPQDALRPVVILPAVQPEGLEQIAVVMPMRL